MEQNMLSDAPLVTQVKYFEASRLDQGTRLLADFHEKDLEDFRLDQIVRSDHLQREDLCRSSILGDRYPGISTQRSVALDRLSRTQSQL
jgi:hypothetical protein